MIVDQGGSGEVMFLFLIFLIYDGKQNCASGGIIIFIKKKKWKNIMLNVKNGLVFLRLGVVGGMGGQGLVGMEQNFIVFRIDEWFSDGQLVGKGIL